MNVTFFIAGLTGLIALLFILNINKLLDFDDSLNRVYAISMVVGWSVIAIIVAIIDFTSRSRK